MVAEVEEAVALIREAFSEHTVNVTNESQGGAYVEVLDIPLGDTYEQDTTWIGFLITFQYPETDVYPHFVRHDLTRKDGKELGGGFSKTKWQEKDVTQISRKSHRLKPETDQALTKLVKVIEWLNNQ